MKTMTEIVSAVLELGGMTQQRAHAISSAHAKVTEGISELGALGIHLDVLERAEAPPGVEFPKMLYSKDAPFERVVHTHEEEDEATHEGWSHDPL